jgi:hypothetical protein
LHDATSFLFVCSSFDLDMMASIHIACTIRHGRGHAIWILAIEQRGACY